MMKRGEPLAVLLQRQAIPMNDHSRHSNNSELYKAHMYGLDVYVRHYDMQLLLEVEPLGPHMVSKGYRHGSRAACRVVYGNKPPVRYFLAYPAIELGHHSAEVVGSEELAPVGIAEPHLHIDLTQHIAESILQGQGKVGEHLTKQWPLVVCVTTHDLTIPVDTILIALRDVAELDRRTFDEVAKYS